MAVLKGQIIYSAKKLSPAIGFFGKVFEAIGRPLFWGSLLASYWLLKLVAFGLRIRFLIPRALLRLKPRTVKVYQTSQRVIWCAPKIHYRFVKWLINSGLHSGIVVVQHLRRIKIRAPRLNFRLPRITLKWIVFSLSLTLLLTTAGLTFYFQIIKDLPNPDKLITRSQPLTTKIYDRRGQLLYKIYRQQNRTLVKLKDIPATLTQATIAIEDAEFYQHNGLSLKGIFRAAVADIRGQKFEGGSTITQQLVKNTLLTPERTLKRKIKEIILAILVERRLSKDQILQMYLNEVNYGGSAYGVEEASWLYFGKSVSQLTLAESSLLAGLPASPTTYSPFGAHPEKAKERQRLVLRRMQEEGYISSEEADKAQKEEIKLQPQKIDIKAPHFVMYVKDILARKYGEQLVEEGGLEVKTSLDLDIQNTAQTITENEIDNLKRLRINNGAALVTNPKTGEILAMVGSKDYFDLANDGNFNVTTSIRQPGSSIKPVNYAVALQMGFTPATIISDTPITYQIPGQPPYSPKNYDNRFHGNVPLRIALGSSYNVPAVKVLSALGVDRMIEQGKKMGITTWNDPSRYGLSLTLGGGDVKMVDMAVAYGTLANMGTRVDLQPILEVKDYKGSVLEKSEIKGESVLPGEIAFLLTDILSDNSARTPAFGPRSQLNISNHPHVAVKTGTTQNLRDNWTVGYTQDYVIVVWVGNNDNSPMSWVASGVTGASPIWNKIMTSLLKDIPDKEFPKPEGLVRLEICPVTGTLPCEGCGGKWEYFLSGTEPKTSCNPEQFKPNQPESTPTPYPKILERPTERIRGKYSELLSPSEKKQARNKI